MCELDTLFSLWIYHLYIQISYIMFIIILSFNNIFALKFLTQRDLS